MVQHESIPVKNEFFKNFNPENLAKLDSIVNRFDRRESLTDLQRAELNTEFCDCVSILNEVYFAYVYPDLSLKEVMRKYPDDLEEFQEFLNILSCLITNQDIPVDWPNSIDFEKADPTTIGCIEYHHKEKIERSKSTLCNLVLKLKEDFGWKKEPLNHIEMIILQKLKSLKDEKMTVSQILFYLDNEHKTSIDEKTARTYLKKLVPYGIQHKAKSGYYYMHTA